MERDTVTPLPRDTSLWTMFPWPQRTNDSRANNIQPKWPMAMLPILKDVRRNILNFKCRLNRKIDDFSIESILWQECDSNNNVFKVVCVFWNILLFSSTIKIFQFTPLRLYFSPDVLSVWQCNFLQNITHSPTLNNILTLNSLLLSLKASTEHEETWWRLFEIKCKHANILF